MAEEPPKGRCAVKFVCMYVCMYVCMSCLLTFSIHSLYLKRILYPRTAFSAVRVRYLRKVFATIDILKQVNLLKYKRRQSRLFERHNNQCEFRESRLIGAMIWTTVTLRHL